MNNICTRITMRATNTSNQKIQNLVTIFGILKQVFKTNKQQDSEKKHSLEAK
jgi:hypothetical protein